MAKESGLAVEVFDEKKIAALKMGALLSVAQGSAEPPRFIVVTYIPKPNLAPLSSARRKAVTFTRASPLSPRRMEK